MKINRIALLLLTGVTLCACEPPPPAATESAQTSLSGNITTQFTGLDNNATNTDNAVAIVNGEPLPAELLVAYREFRKSQGAAEDAAITEQEALDELINMQLLVQKAEKENLHKSPLIAMLLRLQHDGILAQQVMSNMLSEHPVTDEQLQQAYEKEYADKKQKEYHARHILLKEKAEAEAIITQLQGGADFAKLAKEKSAGPSAPYGGELEWFTLDSVLPEFASAITTLDNNQITPTPVKTRYGWHVIQLQESRAISPPPLDQVRDTLLTQLKTTMLEESIEALRGQADIQILHENRDATK